MKNKKIFFISLVLFIILLIIFVLYFLFGRTKYFIVTFDTDGGTAISDIKVSNREIIKLPKTPKKDGYTFIGWANKEGNIVTKETKFTKDITLKAKWINNNSETVAVSFDTDGGNTIDNIIMEKNNVILLPIAPIKEGYIFNGWIDENGNIISTNMIILNNIKLKAYWIKEGVETKTITINTDGGNKIDKIIVEKGKIILLPVNPKKEGYVFNGWVDENGNSIPKDLIIKDNITIKALWKDPYTCPEDCIPVGDGSKCTKDLTTNMITSSTCPNGYTMNNGKCTGTKYHANNGSNGWECNNSSDYMYTEEDGFGGAFMWCVQTAPIVKKQVCPSGYEQSENICKRTETINCVAN